MKYLLVLAVLFLASPSFSQSKFTGKDISINGFRNPSIGAEFRVNHFSVHAGYYPTNFESGVTTEFIRTGVSYWFLPVDSKPIPSSFYASLSYARGMTREYKDANAGMAEIGFRWMVYKGLNLRLGVAALVAEGQDMKINPTPGISYSFKIK